jgi:transposase InsO family protein
MKKSTPKRAGAPPGLRHPHDRGVQDAAQASGRLRADYGIAWSRRRQGAGGDHAGAKRCFGSLQREWTANRRAATRQAARDAGIDSLERVDHSRRKPAYLGSVSPNASEKIAQAASACVRFHLTTTLRAYPGLYGCPPRSRHAGGQGTAHGVW